METYTAATNRYNSTVKYNFCGNSGLKIPQLSLGLWHNFGDVDNQDEALKMLKYAFDNGITHFDLANNYGTPFGSAETNFGKILKKQFASYRDEMLISTKAGHEMWCGPYGNGGSRKYLLSSLDQSLKRMQLDYVDIFYSHRYDPETPLEETMGALSSAVKQGKALYIGISKYPEDKAKEAYRILKENGTPCLIFQGRYSMFTREIETEVIPLAKENGVGFIGFSPLAQGMLSTKYLNGIPTDSRAAHSYGFLKESQITTEVISKVDKLNTLAQKRNQTLAQMALSWCFNQRQLCSIIIGTSSVKQLSENINALENLHFSQEEIDEINAICLS